MRRADTALVPVSDFDLEVAGRILRHAETMRSEGGEPGRRIALFAEALAYTVASTGVSAGQGWLAGVWHVGGVREVEPGLTIHDVVWELQRLVGVQIVTNEPIVDSTNGVTRDPIDEVEAYRG